MLLSLQQFAITMSWRQGTVVEDRPMKFRVISYRPAGRTGISQCPGGKQRPQGDNMHRRQDPLCSHRGGQMFDAVYMTMGTGRRVRNERPTGDQIRQFHRTGWLALTWKDCPNSDVWGDNITVGIADPRRPSVTLGVGWQRLFHRHPGSRRYS